MKQSYEEKIAELRDRFVRNADKRLASMTQLADEAMAGSGSALSDLHRQLHDMGGNAMMLSFEQIGLIARTGQEFVSSVEKNGQVAEIAELTGVFEELSDAIAQARQELGVNGSATGNDGSAGLRADDS